MTPPRLLALIVSLFVFAGATYAVIGWPFDSDDPPGSPAVAVEDATKTPEPVTTVSPREITSGDDCAPGVDASFMSANQIVSYYGNPYAEQLGILGQHEPEDLAALLKDHARTIDDLNGFRGVQPAFHIVYETAQPLPQENGLYLLYVDDDTMQTYFDIACEQHLFVFLDLQIGRSDVETEITKVLPYLHGSNVHVALDPEFTMLEGEIPGQVIGHLDAARINAAQQILEDYVVANNLPDKILVVHQFDEAMITDPENIATFQHVRFVIDMDGFGPKETKIRKFGTFTSPVSHSAFKVFYKQDTPPMTDEEVLALNPDIVIFQ